MELDMRICRRDGEIRVLHCRGGVDDRPGRVDAAGSTAPASTSRTGAAPSAAWPRRSGSPSSARGTGTSPATRSRGRARCTGSSARTQSTSSRPGRLLAQRIVEEDLDAITEQITPRASAAATSTRSPASGARRGDPRRPLPRLDGAGARQRGRPPARDLPGPHRRPPRRGGPRRGGRALPLGVRARARSGWPCWRATGASRSPTRRWPSSSAAPARALLDCTVGDVTHPDDMRRDERGAARG